MSQEATPQFAQPTDQHAWLMGHVGTWTVDCKFFMDPSAPPLELRATETVQAHGRFFVVSRFEADFMGMPFTGIAQIGYDPVSACFQSTWIDTLNPHLYVFTGSMSEDGKVLDMRGEAPDPNSKQTAVWRTREEAIDADTRRFAMWMQAPGGPEIQLFEHLYRRA